MAEKSLYNFGGNWYNKRMKVLLGKQKTSRVWELDVLRGIAVLAMVFDHLMFDFEGLPGYFSDWNKAGGFMRWLHDMGTAFELSAFREYGHFIFVSLFLILVGISCTFSRSNGKRAAEVGLAATIIYVATAFLTSIGFLDEPIVWGILQNITFSIVLYMTVKTIWDNKYFMLGAGAAIILAGILIDWNHAQHASLVPAGLNWFDRLAWFMKNDFADVVWGLKWFGPDHFGVLPCAGMALAGGYIGQTWYRSRRSLVPKLDGGWTRPFKWVGKHALLLYVAHQPLTMAVTVLLGLIFGLTPAL